MMNKLTKAEKKLARKELENKHVKDAYAVATKTKKQHNAVLLGKSYATAQQGVKTYSQEGGKVAAAALASTVLPGLYTCRRSTPYTSEPTLTAVVHDFRYVDWSVSKTKPADGYYDNGITTFAVTTDPFNAIVWNKPNPTALEWGKQVFFYSAKTVGTSASDVFLRNRCFVPTNINSQYLPLALTRDVGVNGIQAEDVSYCKVLNGTKSERLIWVDAIADSTPALSNQSGIELSFYTVNTETPLAVTGGVSVARACGEVLEPVMHYDIGAATFIAIPIVRSGWYGVQVTISGSASGTDIGMKTTGFSPLLMHEPMSSVQQNLDSLNDVRVNGSAITFSPASTAWAEGGDLVTVQLEHTILPENFMIDKDCMDTTLAMPNAVRRNYKEGCYIYNKPTSQEWGSWTNSIYRTSFNSGVLGDGDQVRSIQVVSNLYPTSTVLVVCKAAPNPDSQVGAPLYPGALSRVRIDFSLEAKSQRNQFFREEMPSQQYEQYEHGLALVRNCPQHFDNPFHISDIFKWFKEKALPVIKKIAGPVALGLSALEPELAIPAGIAADFIKSI
jgi:hypothetical protein